MRSFRFVHVGVAALLAAGVASAVGVLQTVNATGTASSFVPIVPCRLADTRPGTDHVGTVAGAIGAGQTAIFAIWGTNGNCTIPSNATAVATNITAVNANAASYLTIYPADANPRPKASNLNYSNGSPPTPNQVTVALSASGAIGAYNNAGTVDIIIDIVGFYQPGTEATQGIQGIQGIQGLPGPAGAPGLSGVVLVTATGSVPPFGSAGNALAVCPTGKQVIGGGAGALYTTLRMYGSRPYLNSWYGVFTRDNVDANSAPFEVYAICATVAP